MIGGPAGFSRDEVYRWTDGSSSIDLSVVADLDPTVGQTPLRMFSGAGSADTSYDSGGGVHEVVYFSACGHGWILTANTAGTGVEAGEVVRVAEGLVPAEPNVEDPTGVAVDLWTYKPFDETMPIPIHGPIPGAGPSSGRAVVTREHAEPITAEMPDTGRLFLPLAPGRYEVAVTLPDGQPCAAGGLAVDRGHVAYFVASCRVDPVGVR